jgi:hypothetical protein
MPPPVPPVNIEAELPKSEANPERDLARQQSAMQYANMFPVNPNAQPTAVPVASSNASDVEKDFENFKANVEKNEDVETPASK